MSCHCHCDCAEQIAKQHVQIVVENFRRKHSVDFRTEERMARLASVIQPRPPGLLFGEGETVEKYLDRLYNLAK